MDQEKKEIPEKEEKKEEALDAEKNHSDVEQDKELIMQMLKKYVGEDENIEEAYKIAREAFESYLEMGNEKDKALEKCESYIELAKHMAKKSEAKKESEEKSEEKPEEEKKESESVESKESLKSEIVKLKGEIAALKEAAQKRELEEYIDSSLQKSGLSRSVTKVFKESVKDIKNKNEFDRLFKVFVDGFKTQAESGEAHKFALGAEKNIASKSTALVDLSGLKK